MAMVALKEDIKGLVNDLNLAEKIERSLELLREAYEEFRRRPRGRQQPRQGLVPPSGTWRSRSAPTFAASSSPPVTSRRRPCNSCCQVVAEYPRLAVYRSDAAIADRLYETDPNRCCDILKVEPTRRAIEEMGVACWVTGLRRTEGRTWTDFQEVEQRDEDSSS